jgi:hypothetical protein
MTKLTFSEAGVQAMLKHPSDDKEKVRSHFNVLYDCTISAACLATRSWKLKLQSAPHSSHPRLAGPPAVRRRRLSSHAPSCCVRRQPPRLLRAPV